MNIKFFPAILAAVFLMTSCSNIVKDSSQRKEISIDDGYKTTKNGEIIIDGRDTEGKDKPLLTTMENSQGVSRSTADGSQIDTMLDGFGNKTETRSFYNDNLIQKIVLRTSPNGQKKAFVYAQNGEVKILPFNMVDKVLTASSEDLAQAAGILAGRDENNQPESVQTLQTKPIDAPLNAPESVSLKETPLPQPQNTEKNVETSNSEPVNQPNPVISEQKPVSNDELQRQINQIQLQTNKVKSGVPQESRVTTNKIEGRIEK